MGGSKFFFIFKKILQRRLARKSGGGPIIGARLPNPGHNGCKGSQFSRNRSPKTAVIGGINSHHACRILTISRSRWLIGQLKVKSPTRGPGTLEIVAFKLGHNRIVPTLKCARPLKGMYIHSSPTLYAPVTQATQLHPRPRGAATF